MNEHYYHILHLSIEFVHFVEVLDRGSHVHKNPLSDIQQFIYKKAICHDPIEIYHLLLALKLKKVDLKSYPRDAQNPFLGLKSNPKDAQNLCNFIFKNILRTIRKKNSMHNE